MPNRPPAVPARSTPVLFPAVAALLLLAFAAPARAQVADTVLTWRTYSGARQARVRVYRAADEERPQTVVIDERAGGARPVTDEARYFVETVGREMGFDPAAATFVFRYTASAFAPGGADDGKALLVRLTLRRGRSGELGSPNWRAITPEELEDLTDRQLR